jgi:uncharacterized phage protein (TIGR01671 family)
MREIKFRAKRVDNGEWVYGYYESNPLTGKSHIFSFDNECSYVYEVKPETVGQFTGLLDKQGREIYEGDIVKICVPNTAVDEEEMDNFKLITVEIYFENGSFWFQGEGCTDCNWHFYNAGEREVIGNIYENPELLTGGSSR